MATRDQALELAKRLHGLDGGPDLRRKAAARTLAGLHPTDATQLIAELLGLSKEGSEPARCVLASFVSALGQEARDLPHAHQLRRLARLQELPQVADLFAEGPAARVLDERAAARRDAQLFTQTLGFLKTQARLVTDPDQMAKLAAASSGEIVRELLRNPRLTEPWVVRMAARRPARPETLVEVWRNPRWFARHAVKRALVFNPYLPPEVGAKIVPLLSQTDWRELSSDTAVHPALRDQARLLLSGPPPAADAPPASEGPVH
jgi:hypothetical protein